MNWVTEAERRMYSGDEANGLPSRSKKEQSMQSVGISEKGSMNAVEKRGIT